MSCAGGPVLVRNGLVLCLDAADKQSYSGSGSIYRDLSGQNNDCTLRNGPTFSNNNGGCIVLDGTDDNVYCPTSNFDNITNLTYDLWFNPNNITGIRTLIAKELICKYRINNGTLETLSSSNGSSWNLNNISTSSIISLNRWYNATLAVVSNGNISLYLNGTLISSISLGGALGTSLEKIIIGSYGNGPEPFSGRISQAKIYNRALSANEILQNYKVLKGRFLLT